jgi:hypothetical protein
MGDQANKQGGRGFYKRTFGWHIWAGGGEDETSEEEEEDFQDGRVQAYTVNSGRIGLPTKSILGGLDPNEGAKHQAHDGEHR